MRNYALRASISAALIALSPVPAMAGSNANAKVAMHLQAHTTKGVCAAAPAFPCNEGESNLTVSGNILTPYDVYIVVVDADSSKGLAGVNFGITYDNTVSSGVDVVSWQLCGGAQYMSDDWPESGQGGSVIWSLVDDCQKSPAVGDDDGDVSAVVGVLYIYAYSADVLSVTARNYLAEPDFKVCDCSRTLTSLSVNSAAGKVSLGTAGGVDPCE